MEKLKPCPFCGGEAKIKTRYYRAINYYNYSGVCQECNASMDVKDTEAEAIEAWNTRHERMCRTVLDKYGNYTCGVCGEVLLSGWADPFEAIPLECFKYCFNCGARVKEDTYAD